MDINFVFLQLVSNCNNERLNYTFGAWKIQKDSVWQLKKNLCHFSSYFS